MQMKIPFCPVSPCRGKEKGDGLMSIASKGPYLRDAGQTIFDSFQHLSQSHIIPRTLPVVVIILAACMGLPQHWGLVFTMAFLLAAFAVLLNSAIFPYLQR
jgi:hypothetical protein